MVRATALREDLRDAGEEKNHRHTAMSDPATEQIQELSSRLSKVSAEVETLKKDSISLLKDPEQLAGAESLVIARMNRNMSWAIHFSTVRMTIGTFFITVCIALMGLKWAESSRALVFAAGAIWVCGMLLFGVFTRLTYNQVAGELARRNQIRFRHEEIKTAKSWRTDAPLIVLVVISIVVFIFGISWWKKSKPLPEPVVPAGTVPAWRLDAVEGLNNLVGIDLSDLPEGTVSFWITRGGKKEMLTDAEIDPDHDQFAYFGVDAGGGTVLFAAVVSEASPRAGGIGYFNDKDIGPFRSMVEKDHDWSRPAIIAAEATRDGRIYGVFTPALPKK
jgi:hypothetical protein